MFVRNAWYVAAAAEEITGKPLARTLLNEPVVIFRNGRGEIAALADRCCHRGAPLSLGNATERGIRCGYHGLEFDREGMCIEIPGQRVIPKHARVLSYPVFLKADYVWIWLGQADKADPSEIVDYPPDDQINWPRAHDMLHLQASYIMVLENLMDLSHLSYLHKTSIGSSDGQCERVNGRRADAEGHAVSPNHAGCRRACHVAQALQESERQGRSMGRFRIRRPERHHAV